MKTRLTLILVIFEIVLVFIGFQPDSCLAAENTGYDITASLWAKAVLEVPGSPVTLIWKEVGTDITPGGDQVISGYFYGDPNDFAYGSEFNPEVFVKIYIAKSGWCNIAFNHVTVDNVGIYSAHNYAGTPDQSGTASLTSRLVENQYDDVKINDKSNATFEIGHASRSFPGSPGSSGDLPVEFYYPAESAGINAQIVSGLFPIIIFAHGYQQSYLDYAYVWKEMVPAGYIVALLNRLGASAAIDIDEYALDIEDALSKIQEMGNDTNSVFYGHVENTYVLMGHSTGGGAIFIAASKPESKTASNAVTIVSLASLGQVFGPISGHNPIDAAPGVAIPSLIIDGAKDCIAPRDTHTQLIYNNLSSGITRYIVTITEGDHCGFSDETGPGQSICTLAEFNSCVGLQGSAMDTNEQNLLTLGFMKRWIEYFVRGEDNAWSEFQDRLADDRTTFQSGS